MTAGKTVEMVSGQLGVNLKFAVSLKAATLGGEKVLLALEIGKAHNPVRELQRLSGKKRDRGDILCEAGEYDREKTDSCSPSLRTRETSLRGSRHNRPVRGSNGLRDLLTRRMSTISAEAAQASLSGRVRR
ncbi:hypothetical protein ACFFWD_03605 [Bradyrhizobium erythrophlei]|uniref:hypothetical protein n=1 Tax=Bradyrhizobium erythrophlei TaxID=1437360 RepID=UPI0035F0CD3B